MIVLECAPMNERASVAGVREGDVLAGKYRIDRILGAGGMGVVVAAHHVHLDERVAIKFLLPEMLSSGEAVARFSREARAAVKIKNEHVARVADVGTLENGAPYMVMEFLEGSDLGAWLRQRGALSIEQAADFVLQACEAIAEAHTLGIIHRDLKPPNLFVTRRPDGSLSVKVLDFGISKVRGQSSSVPDVSITKTSAIMGSPLYMSPEQMQSSKDVDVRADIWALGVILYELVTGEAPFLAETMQEVVAKILSVRPPPMSSKRSDVPPGFEAVVLKCLEKDRTRRYESVGLLAVDLLPFAPRRSRVSVERISGVMRSSGLSATGLATPPSSDPSEQVGTQGAWGQTNASGGRTTMTLAGIALFAVAGGGAFLAFRERTLPVTTEPATSVASQNEASKPTSEPFVEAPLSAPVQPAAPIVSFTPVASAVPSAAVRSAPAEAAATRRKAAVVKSPPPAAAEPVAPTVSSPLPATVAPKPSPSVPRKAPGAFDDRK
jgi:serine/threonine-protein kinase